jgi:Lrp/AsnC family transcriptional regulator, leucine-responsive regulatory protein
MTSSDKRRARRTQDFDEIDRKILAILELDSRRPTSDIGRLVGLTGPATAERISRMRDKGVIRAFTVDLDPAKLGLNISAFVEFEPHSNADAAGLAAVAGHPAVRSCWKVTGPAMLILVVNARDGGELHNVLLEISKHGSTKTSVILSSELEQMPLFANRPQDVIAALLKRTPPAPRS